MQIDFQATKLKEANAYVDLLHPPKLKLKIKPVKKNEISFFKKVFKFLFR